MNVVTHIYWEKQGLDLLCGVHCLNSLMQGPYFDEVQLSNIAQELDQQEISLMTADGNNDQEEITQFLKEGSNNVADDGNFSIQVIQKALEHHNLEVESINVLTYKEQDLTLEQGFICNRNHHWVAYRKINEVWYVLDSLYKLTPETISPFFLSALFYQTKEFGFSVFVIKGEFPQQKVQNQFKIQEIKDLSNYQKLIPVEEIQNLQEIQKIQEQELQQSYKDERNNQQYSQKIYREKACPDDQMSKIERQMKQQTIKMKSNYENFRYGDQEIFFVLQMTLKEKYEFPQKKDLTIQFSFPDSSLLFWTFSEDEKVEDLYDFVLSRQNNQNEFILQSKDEKLFQVEQLIKNCNILDHDSLDVTEI